MRKFTFATKDIKAPCETPLALRLAFLFCCSAKQKFDCVWVASFLRYPFGISPHYAQGDASAVLFVKRFTNGASRTPVPTSLLQSGLLSCCDNRGTALAVDEESILRDLTACRGSRPRLHPLQVWALHFYESRITDGRGRPSLQAFSSGEGGPR